MAFATRPPVASVTVTAANQPPAAEFSSKCTDLGCDFTDASTDDGTVSAWSWDFGDGKSATTQNPSHSYGQAGSYQVKLTVTDDKGATNSVTHSVTVTAPNQPPAAAFSVKCTDLGCDFTDASTDDGTVNSWSWDFGDGSSSTQQNPSHTYASDGPYTVTLVVTDDGGATARASQDITVTSSAAAGGP